MRALIAGFLFIGYALAEVPLPGDLYTQFAAAVA